MAKFFAVTIIVIAIVSAIPILRHTWWMAEDISTHGQPIDDQMSETMAEAGISFLASQILLAVFIWMFSNAKPGDKIKNFPGGATAMVLGGFLLVGTEVLALGAFGAKLGHLSISPLPPPIPFRSRCKRDSSLSISDIPVPTESLVLSIRIY